MLKYGIIGLGSISKKHLEGYAKHQDEVKLEAICDVKTERLEAVGNQYDVPQEKRFTNYKDLLNVSGLDFVCICLPNHMHASFTIEALDKGLHVHCEKPMAMNGAETKEMLKAAERNNKQLMIGLNNRFLPQIHYIKQLVNSGKIGEIYFVKCGWIRRNGLAHAGWYTDKQWSGGGPLIDLGVHFIDLAMYFMDYPKITSVDARTFCAFGNSDKKFYYSNVDSKPSTEYNVEDMAVGMLELENKAVVQFEINWASNIEHDRAFCEIYGSEMGVRYSVQDYSPQEPQGVKSLELFGMLDGQHVNITPIIDERYMDKVKIDEFLNFITSIKTGIPSDVAVASQASAMMEIIDRIYKSAEEHRAI